MSTFKWICVVFFAFNTLSGVRVYAQSLTEAEKRSWLPTLAEANALLQDHERVLVDGKEAEPIPNPMFAFPVSGTPVGETGLEIGDSFELTGTLADGKPFKLVKDKKAKGTIILFLSSSCGACLAELPLEKALYVKYRERGLRVVCVNVWDDSKAAADIIEKHKIPWDVVATVADGRLEENINVDRLPLILLLNDDLQIVNATHTGKFALRVQTISPPIVYTSNTIQSLEKLLAPNGNAK